MSATAKQTRKLRHLIVVCGDQLDHHSSALDGFDTENDAILMTEAAEEATYVWQSKRRIAFFFAAMRHFCEEQRTAGRTVFYHQIDDPNAPESLPKALTDAINAHAPERVLLVRPGDHRVLTMLEKAAEHRLSLCEDRHFYTTVSDFAALEKDRKRFILEDFYRVMRKRTGLLMDGNDPVGGQWNLDKDNRASFGKNGPGLLIPRQTFPHSEITTEVLRVVNKHFPDAPGSLDNFDEPVTRDQARAALEDFIQNRLPEFGTYQDAMWDGASTLNHSRLSAAMNVKLLDPRTACQAAADAFAEGHAPLNAVEGFVRQILGWREYTRGIYWTRMPEYADLNTLDATHDLPAFFWTAETDMACLRDMISKLLDTGYAHHIERLMGMGLYMLLHGVRPYAAHDWHMGLYLDAIDWVSLPNMLGMSQHADGGVVGTKPYCASGAYINRMSNYCSKCRFDPKQATGEKACPFTTLYWDFLARHEERFAPNRRMKFQISNLRRKDPNEISSIRNHAETVRSS